MPLLRSPKLKKHVGDIIEKLDLGSPGADEAARRLIELDPDYGFPYLVLGQLRSAMRAGRTPGHAARDPRYLMRTSAPLLSKKNRRWVADAVQGDAPFMPSILEMGWDELTIEDVCLEGLLLPDADDELDDVFDEELDEDAADESVDDPVVQRTTPARPERNDPCWCGSGKK